MITNFKNSFTSRLNDKCLRGRRPADASAVRDIEHWYFGGGQRLTVNDHAANSVSEYTNIYKYHVFKLQDGDGRYFGAKYKITETSRRKMPKTDDIYNTAVVMSHLASAAFESQSFYTVVD